MYAQKPFHAYDFCNIIIETKPTPQRKYLRFDKPKWQNQKNRGCFATWTLQNIEISNKNSVYLVLCIA